MILFTTMDNKSRFSHTPLHVSSKRPLFLSFSLGLVLFLLGLYFPVLQAEPSKPAPPSFQIYGVSDKVLQNVDQRLVELGNDRDFSSFSESELKAAIEKALFPFGYFKPEIQIDFQKNNALVVHITAGPLLKITQLSIRLQGEGRNNSELVKAVAEFPLKVGDALNSMEYEAAKQGLMYAAQGAGFQAAHFDKAEILIDKARYSSVITLEFNTGSQYFFGQVRFDPSYISPKLMKRFLPFKPGQPFSSAQMTNFNDSLTASGYFKSVTVKPGIDALKNLYIPIDVHVEPATRTNYSLGLGYGTDTQLRGQAGLHVVPVNPAGHKFNAVALGSFRENTLKSQYVIPGHNPLIDQYEITGSFSTFDYNSGYSNSSLLSLAQRHNLPNFQRVLSLNNLYERFHYRNQPNENVYSFFPEASLTWLSKKDPLFSPQGYSLALDAFVANKTVLSQVNFAQASVDAKAAITFAPIRTRLLLHGIAGTTQIKNIDKMPLSRALLLGGAENMKGFAYNSLGPGKVLSYGGFEIQKETKPKWYLVGFLDAGDVHNPRPAKLLMDAGIGLMWISPLGPIKIGVASPLGDTFAPDYNKKPQLIIKMGSDL